MYCNGCGQALVAGQAFCPRCGYASGLGMPVAPGSPPYGVNFPGMFSLATVERRGNALAGGWVFYAGLGALTGLIGRTGTLAAMGLGLGTASATGIGMVR